jgi:cell division protein FtsW
MTTTTRRTASRSTSSRSGRTPKPPSRQTPKPTAPRPRSAQEAASRAPSRARVNESRPATINGERISALLGFVVLALSLFGLVMVLSASSVTSVHEFDASPFYQFKRQAMWAVLGAVTYVVASRVDYRRLQQVARPLLAGTIVLLVAVLIPGVGKNINGSSRWLGVGPVVIQPSEIAKLALVVFIADLLAKRAKKMDRPDLTVRPVMTVIIGLSGLMLLQPKLGTPLILAAIALLMLYVAGGKISSLVAWSFAGVTAATFFAYSEPYRRARLLAFMDPWADPLGTGLQTIQSQVGIASGGWLGVGLGASRTKWGFLPYAHSDFIFAVVAEEVGFIGAGALIMAFVLLGYLGIRIALGAQDRFGMLLAAGITGWLLIQAFLNIGMAMGLLPITGEPLPFVSAGGSSLVMTLLAAGILTNVARQARVS